MDIRKIFVSCVLLFLSCSQKANKTVTQPEVLKVVKKTKKELTASYITDFSILTRNKLTEDIDSIVNINFPAKKDTTSIGFKNGKAKIVRLNYDGHPANEYFETQKAYQKYITTHDDEFIVLSYFDDFYTYQLQRLNGKSTAYNHKEKVRFKIIEGQLTDQKDFDTGQDYHTLWLFNLDVALSKIDYKDFPKIIEGVDITKTELQIFTYHLFSGHTVKLYDVNTFEKVSEQENLPCFNYLRAIKIKKLAGETGLPSKFGINS